MAVPTASLDIACSDRRSTPTDQGPQSLQRNHAGGRIVASATRQPPSRRRTRRVGGAEARPLTRLAQSETSGTGTSAGVPGYRDHLRTYPPALGRQDLTQRLSDDGVVRRLHYQIWESPSGGFSRGNAPRKGARVAGVTRNPRKNQRPGKPGASPG